MYLYIISFAEPFGWHYLSNATCVVRPRLSYAFFVVSRITIICYVIRHC